MLLMVDECLPASMVAELRDRGHDVVWVSETYPSFEDDKILTIATSEGRIVMTEDRDFGLLTMRLRRPAIGLIIAHVSRFEGKPTEIAKRIADVVDSLADSCRGVLTVIEPERARQRPLP